MIQNLEKKKIGEEGNLKKIEIDGWIEVNEKPKNNIPKVCPKCNRKLNRTNVLSSCGWFFVYCMNLKCRWSEIFEE